MTFIAKRITKTHNQINCGTPDVVFPLLCPMREADWLEDWEYKMIYSESGFAEKGCVFSTPYNHYTNTLWYITVHDSQNHEIEFVRITENEIAVKISIQLTDNQNGTTTSSISYEYTSLNEKQNEWIDNESESYFNNMMNVWELSINHYIKTGEKLIIEKA